MKPSSTIDRLDLCACGAAIGSAAGYDRVKPDRGSITGKPSDLQRYRRDRDPIHSHRHFNHLRSFDNPIDGNLPETEQLTTSGGYGYRVALPA